jgi:hypothetical protein
MKFIIAVICALIIGVGVFWFWSSRAHNSTSSVLETHLLIDAAHHLYAFQLIGQSVPDGYEDKGGISQYTNPQIAKMTSGMTLVSLGTPPSVSVDVQIPTDAQLPAWQQAVNSLTVQQRQWCTNLAQADSVQYCLVRHLVFNALAQKKDASICAAIFVDSYRQECQQDIKNQNTALVDTNRNGIIDTFELVTPTTK